jgi:hypothetical protein
MNMRLCFGIMLTVVVLTIAYTGVPVSATLQNGTTDEMGDPPLILGGSWVVLDQTMKPGDFFAGTYTWDSAGPVVFTITDLYVVTDSYEVYDFGIKVATTPTLPDWNALGLGTAYVSPPWAGTPDQALADGRFSSASILFAAGSHEITIRDIHIPDLVPGVICMDGTVAFKANAVPEPSSILALLSCVGGLGGLVWWRR